MRLHSTNIAGAWVIEPEPIHDERGWFARVFDGDEIEKLDLTTRFAQHSLSFNAQRGTLRGMHYQAAPCSEAKLIRCVAGAIHDVIIDLRTRDAFAVELTAENRLALYVPPQCAHGFLTLTGASEVLYLISEPYDAALARGVRWNDPAFAIQWPFLPVVISARDATFPDFRQAV
jgi:dTDP-4-dehydrorhamnose 3,5-epimerase